MSRVRVQTVETWHYEQAEEYLEHKEQMLKDGWEEEKQKGHYKGVNFIRVRNWIKNQ